MGVWGEGNFDGDLPRDFLAEMVGRWELMVEKLLDDQPAEEAVALDIIRPGLDACEACVMPTIEIIIAVAERLEPDHLPAPETVERWRSRYLNLFDRECGSWDAGPEFEAQRRGVVEATFQRLLAIVRARPQP